MAKLSKHRGFDLANEHTPTNTGVHLHDDPNFKKKVKSVDPWARVTQQLPRPKTLGNLGQGQEVMLVIKSSIGNIHLGPTNMTINTNGPMGIYVVEAEVPEEEFIQKLQAKNNEEDIQFLQDQLDNYSDELSKDFVAGVLAAISIFKGQKYLEDYLGEG